jgi:hypothetical protein
VWDPPRVPHKKTASSEGRLCRPELIAGGVGGVEGSGAAVVLPSGARGAVAEMVIRSSERTAREQPMIGS